MKTGAMPALQPEHAKPSAVYFGDHLIPERVVTDLRVSSKKRLLEEMAGLLHNGDPKLNRATVFRVLTERERLGSTGIGSGVALPHGRVNGLDAPIVAVARLRHEVDFDAIDDQPVRLAVGLLVPAEAHDDHLQLLSGLARLFADADFLRQALEAKDDPALYALLREAHPTGA